MAIDNRVEVLNHVLRTTLTIGENVTDGECLDTIHSYCKEQLRLLDESNDFDYCGFIGKLALDVTNLEYEANGLTKTEVDPETKELLYTEAFMIRFQRVESELHELLEKYRL